jgi:hypothetical protein
MKPTDEQIKHMNVAMALSYLVAKAGGLVEIKGEEFAEFMKDKGMAEITHLEDSTMVLRTTVSVQS